MTICPELFIDLLHQKDLHAGVNERDGKVFVEFPYKGKVTRFVFSGDQGEYVSMFTIIENAPEDKIPAVLVTCNALNAKWKWLKFYLDDDKDVLAEDDAILSPENAADECMELLARRIDILEKSIPDIMKAIYA